MRRLEGWKQAPAHVADPSRLAATRRAPQDDGGDDGGRYSLASCGGCGVEPASTDGAAEFAVPGRKLLKSRNITRAATMQITTNQNSAAPYQMLRVLADFTAIFSAHAARSGSASRNGVVSLGWSELVRMPLEVPQNPATSRIQLSKLRWSDGCFASPRRHAAASCSTPCHFRLDPARKPSLI